jgi:hypothetical protein
MAATLFGFLRGGMRLGDPRKKGGVFDAALVGFIDGEE